MARFDRGLGPEVIVEGSNEVYVDADGTARQGVNVAASPEIVDQYRAGYRCLACHGVQSTAFPEVCETEDRSPGGTWKCGFPIRTMQMERFSREYRGEHRYGPAPLDTLDDEREREAWTKKSGIWVPGAS